jgi:hypothetical protein
MRRLIAALVLCLLDIPVRAEDCVASVYAVSDSSQPGTKTANGIPLNDNAMTAAHKSLPFGSKVKVKLAGMTGTNRRDRAFNRQEALCPAPRSLDWSAPHF